MGHESLPDATWTSTSGPSRRPRARLFGWIAAAAVAGVLATLPYEQSITLSAESVLLPWPALLVASLVHLALVLLCASIGMRLGPTLGLGAPDLIAWVERQPHAGSKLGRAIRRGLLWGAAAGIVTTMLGAAAEAILPLPEELHAASWSPWHGLLGAFGAGINEELIFRLGVMTLFARLLSLLVRRLPPPPALIWTANALAALGFGFAHLPILEVLTEVNHLTVGLVLAGNGLVGLLFGWLYWRSGLVAAMAAHFATDLVLKALVPLLLPL
ncbi:MAG: CPBP family intramembrane metalloprotease [Candidatus Eisenbacteria bacterium]|nr:CPBP family intramembrane metalloprotease [Candidatus Eisenbacteria bacterium]